MSTETENQFNFAPKAHISISRVDHNTSIMKSVDDIFQKQLFTDVCLSCENQIINAHRLILAASTSFFHSLFSQQPCCLNPNPVIVIRDMKINELKAILEFIYYGNVCVPEAEIDSLIKSAESLGVYGLSKLNTSQISELRDDDDDEQQHEVEINNNSINNSKTSPTLRNSPQQTNDRDQSTNANSLDKSNQSNKTQSPATNLNKRKISNNIENEDKRQAELDQLKEKDLEEKRKKRDIINQASTSNQQAENVSTNATSTSQSQEQSSSKRQSLRIRYRKTNPDPTKDSSAFDLLNSSNNSNISLNEAKMNASSNGKRLRRTNSDPNLIADDDLMSVDGSEYNSKKDTINSQDLAEDGANSTSLLSSKLSAVKALRLKRNKNSILKKQSDQSKQFKLMLSKPNTDAYNIVSKLGLKPSEVLSDEDDNADSMCEENVVLKKIDSPASSLNTSRKNSVDSNNGSLLKLNRTANDKQQSELNETTTTGNQSLLASSSLAKQSQQQKNKKKRKLSIDNST